MSKKIKLKIIIALLTAILILASSFIPFFRHSHECIDVDCEFCALVASSRELLVAAILLAGIYELIRISFTVSYNYSRFLPICDGTPVGLKVKLSN